MNALNSDKNVRDISIGLFNSATISEYNSTNNPKGQLELFRAENISSLLLNKWNMYNGYSLSATNVDEFNITNSHLKSSGSVDVTIIRTKLSFLFSTLIFNNNSIYLESTNSNISFANCHLSQLDIPNAVIDQYTDTNVTQIDIDTTINDNQHYYDFNVDLHSQTFESVPSKSYLLEEMLKVSECLFIKTSSENGYGGAIYAINTKIVLIDFSTFIECSSQCGGAIYINRETNVFEFNISKLCFSRCNALMYSQFAIISLNTFLPAFKNAELLSIVSNDYETIFSAYISGQNIKSINNTHSITNSVGNSIIFQSCKPQASISYVIMNDITAFSCTYFINSFVPEYITFTNITIRPDGFLIQYDDTNIPGILSHYSFFNINAESIRIPSFLILESCVADESFLNIFQPQGNQTISLSHSPYSFVISFDCLSKNEEEPSKPSISMIILYVIIGILVVLALSAVVYVVFLRKKVRKQQMRIDLEMNMIAEYG